MAVTKEEENGGATEDKGLVKEGGIRAFPKAPGDSIAKPVSECVERVRSKAAGCEVLKEGSEDVRMHDADNVQEPVDSILVAKQGKNDGQPMDEGALQLAEQSQNCNADQLPLVEKSEPDCLDVHESRGITVDNPAYHESALLSDQDTEDMMLLPWEAFLHEDTEEHSDGDTEDHWYEDHWDGCTEHHWDDDSYGECYSLSLEDVNSQGNPEPSNFSSKESDSDKLQPEVFPKPSDSSCTESDSDEDGKSESAISVSIEGTSDELEALEDWGLDAACEGHGTVSGGPSSCYQCDLDARYDPLDSEGDPFVLDFSSDGADDELSDEFFSDDFSTDDGTGSDDD